MANPLVIDIIENTVTKIATSVTGGFIRNKNRFTPILFTTRLTGQDAPSLDTMLAEGTLMFASDGVNEEISNSAAIDIYVLSQKIDAKLRVDLP